MRTLGMIRGAATAAMAVAVVLTAGCTTATPEGGAVADDPKLDRFMAQKLEFGPCDDPRIGLPAAAVAMSECAKLEVPLDYQEPEGKTIELGLLRVRSTGTDRIGSLLVNPGGPGYPAMSYAAAFAAIWTGTPVRDRFDIVGFDPRGVGISEPVIDCYTDIQRENDAPVSAIAAAGIPWTAEGARELVEQCAQGSGGTEMLAHLGTRDVARDMDVLRAALGDKKLSYAGSSYGTRLGAVYAEIFPENVRALINDSAMDPTKNTRERNLQQAEGMQRTFEKIAAFCATQPDCPLGDDPAQATTVAQHLLRPLLDNPIRMADGRELTHYKAVEGFVSALYLETSWPRLISGFAQLAQGRGDELLALRDVFAGRTATGEYPNTFEATLAINCDDEERLTPDQATDLIKAMNATTPVLDPGIDIQTHHGCEAWPGKSTLGFPYATNIKGLPQTLVIAVTGDPLTPYDGSANLANALGARLLTVDGEQHGALLARNPCISGLAADYLIDLHLPAENPRCSL
ncbi:alpha/beta hydrolase [Nocardia ninae]|uniref:Alpha/beta hydrolase n=1 Tax=Nocardia ninae NBRC 108245 TaxID=1210091 RepID=A0A511MF22_9NOCA|nr:alpha/beta hydrolase [Nocardia ninae]GEM39260.1 alpha/beta hydrolase [Nocardia ninae NBRC 108245]